MKKEIKNWKALGDGDIFVCDINNGLNEDLIGDDHQITGTDCIFVRDDAGSDENSVLVNGGHEVHFLSDDKVIVIGHYSELAKFMEDYEG